MAMSKDRVEFTLKAYYFDNFRKFSQNGENLLRDSLNLPHEVIQKIKRTALHFGEARIVCRPSQFARFLIIREQMGFQNQFKELKAKLIPARPMAPVNEPVDVSSLGAAHTTAPGAE